MEQWLACLIQNLRIYGSSPINWKNQKIIKIQPYSWVLIGRNTVYIYVYLSIYLYIYLSRTAWNPAPPRISSMPGNLCCSNWEQITKSNSFQVNTMQLYLSIYTFLTLVSVYINTMMTTFYFKLISSRETYNYTCKYM